MFVMVLQFADGDDTQIEAPELRSCAYGFARALRPMTLFAAGVPGCKRYLTRERSDRRREGACWVAARQSVICGVEKRAVTAWIV